MASEAGSHEWWAVEREKARGMRVEDTVGWIKMMIDRIDVLIVAWDQWVQDTLDLSFLRQD